MDEASPFSIKSLLVAASSTLTAAAIIWASAGLYSFVHSVYDLRDTVEQRGKLLADLEKLIGEHHGITRKFDSIDAKFGRLEEKLQELEAFKTQGRRYTADDGDRDRSRVDSLEHKYGEHREQDARAFGSLEARIKTLENLLEKKR